MSITEPEDRRVAQSAPAGGGVMTVASVPSSHVYVRHIAALEPQRSSVARLGDPNPDHPDRSTVETWWPPVMLQPRWLQTSAYDLLHIQFGFDATDPEVLREGPSFARDRGAPIVYTAHDLRNPHHVDRGAHDRHLEVLMDHADAVITLTTGAAAEIRARWGRDALVLPHPHVVDFDTMAEHPARPSRSSARGEFRVGVHVKSLRANMDPLTILPVLEEVVASLPGAVLQVNGHRDVLDRCGARRDQAVADYLEAAAQRGGLELHVHDFMDDAALWRYLASLDVSVLPYRFGTHSGWLEACRDLGTTVVAPTCGYYADQGPVLSYLMDEIHFDPETLSKAITRAYEERPASSVSLEARRCERAEIAAAHESLYRRLLA